MNKHIINTAAVYLHKYINGSISSAKIISALEQQGYTTIFYNAVSNTEDITRLSEMLDIGDYIRSSKGFTYTDGNNRIVFINEDLCEEEMIYVFLHEQGHILLRHFNQGNIIGNNVVQEYEANEFVHYILNPTFQIHFTRYRKQFLLFTLSLISVVIIIVLSGTVIQHKSYYGDYYITETGEKYHEEDCIFVKNKDNVHRLTKEEFETGSYMACEMCLPE